MVVVVLFGCGSGVVVFGLKNFGTIGSVVVLYVVPLVSQFTLSRGKQIPVLRSRPSPEGHSWILPWPAGEHSRYLCENMYIQHSTTHYLPVTECGVRDYVS